MDLSLTGKRIKERREALKMTQGMLAEQLDGIKSDGGKSKISKYEHGVVPPLDVIQKLAYILKCDPEYLLGCVDHPSVTASWIAEQLPLSDEVIAYLMWVKNLDSDIQRKLHAGSIDIILSALYYGIADDINRIKWDVDELYSLLVYANEEDERNPSINHTLFLRQSFCMAVGGVAFDYVSALADENMEQLRKDLEELRKDAEHDELVRERIKQLKQESGLTDEQIIEALRSRPTLMELMTVAKDKAEKIEEIISLLEGLEGGNENGKK